MKPLIIFVVICGPLTALLVWVLISELKGVTAFPSQSPPEAGQLDSIGRWIFGLICLALAGVVFAQGGLFAVILITTAISALATLIALLWTAGQAARHLLNKRKATRNRAPPPPPIAPVHRRFMLNFRRTIIRIPTVLLARP